MLPGFFYQNKQSLLELTLKDFESFNFRPQIGVELEFYLRKKSGALENSDIHNFISLLEEELHKQNIDILGIEPEQGFGQVEVKTKPYQNISLLCQDIEKIKKTTQNLQENIQANFAAQPFLDDCGSALQLNLSLLDKNNNNLFAKNNDEESKLLLNAIGGILTFAKNILLLSAPNAEDYLRFDLEINKNLHSNKKYTAPTKISWGYDNRTALIRIPTAKQKEQRRLEFRLPSALADIYLTIFSLLLVVKYGIENDIFPSPATYGNVFNEQYNLPVISTDYEEAKQDFLAADLFTEILKKHQ